VAASRPFGRWVTLQLIDDLVRPGALDLAPASSPSARPGRRETDLQLSPRTDRTIFAGTPLNQGRCTSRVSLPQLEHGPAHLMAAPPLEPSSRADSCAAVSHSTPPFGSRVSAMIRALSSIDQRRRPPAPLITSKCRGCRSGSSVRSNPDTSRTPIPTESTSAQIIGFSGR
jgi:hypothetical protein